MQWRPACWLRAARRLAPARCGRLPLLHSGPPRPPLAAPPARARALSISYEQGLRAAGPQVGPVHTGTKSHDHGGAGAHRHTKQYGRSSATRAPNFRWNQAFLKCGNVVVGKHFMSFSRATPILSFDCHLESTFRSSFQLSLRIPKPLANLKDWATVTAIFNRFNLSNQHKVSCKRFDSFDKNEREQMWREFGFGTASMDAETLTSMWLVDLHYDSVHLVNNFLSDDYKDHHEQCFALHEALQTSSSLQLLVFYPISLVEHVESFERSIRQQQLLDPIYDWINPSSETLAKLESAKVARCSTFSTTDDYCHAIGRASAYEQEFSRTRSLQIECTIRLVNLPKKAGNIKAGYISYDADTTTYDFDKDDNLQIVVQNRIYHATVVGASPFTYLEEVMVIVRPDMSTSRDTSLPPGIELDLQASEESIRQQLENAPAQKAIIFPEDTNKSFRTHVPALMTIASEQNVARMPTLLAKNIHDLSKVDLLGQLPKTVKANGKSFTRDQFWSYLFKSADQHESDFRRRSRDALGGINILNCPAGTGKIDAVLGAAVTLICGGAQGKRQRVLIISPYNNAANSIANRIDKLLKAKSKLLYPKRAKYPLAVRLTGTKTDRMVFELAASRFAQESYENNVVGSIPSEILNAHLERVMHAINFKFGVPDRRLSDLETNTGNAIANMIGFSPRGMEDVRALQKLPESFASIRHSYFKLLNHMRSSRPGSRGTFDIDYKNAREFFYQNEADVIVTSPYNAARQELYNYFSPDLIIIDEAWKIPELETLSLFVRYKSAHSYIICGDPTQGGPFDHAAAILNPYKDQYLTPIAARFTDAGFANTKLQTTHRLVPDIASLLSIGFYNDSLTLVEAVEAKPKAIKVLAIMKELFGVEGHAVAVNVRGTKHEYNMTNKSYQNRETLGVAMQVLADLLGQGYTGKDLAYISPYHAQADLAQRLHPKLTKMYGEEAEHVLVTTVDQAQGTERAFVILDLTRTEVEIAPGVFSMGFLTKNDRINLGISRARYGLVIVGDFDALARAGRFRTSGLGRVYEMLASTDRLVNWARPHISEDFSELTTMGAMRMLPFGRAASDAGSSESLGEGISESPDKDGES